MTPDLDPERRLAVAYAPRGARAALASLWRLDVTLGSILASGRDPMITRIRLAWWREALERLDATPAPAEPVLTSLASSVLPTGITGKELAALEEAWVPLTYPEPMDEAAMTEFGLNRGSRLFHLAARILGSSVASVGEAGAGWALVDLARRSSRPEEAEAAIAAARRFRTPQKWPTPLRPLGMLAILAQADLKQPLDCWESQGSPRRVLQMLRHRITGR